MTTDDLVLLIGTKEIIIAQLRTELAQSKQELEQIKYVLVSSTYMKRCSICSSVKLCLSLSSSNVYISTLITFCCIHINFNNSAELWKSFNVYIHSYKLTTMFF